MELYVGSGAKKVREVFDLARRSRPAIIFIDELEAIGMKRPNDHSSYERNIERCSTLNQLLVEMDGVTDMSNIVVIGSTNREDLLDSALVRPGRFDFKINIPLPILNQRVEIFKLYIEKLKCGNIPEESILKLARDSENFTGAIIEDIVNKAFTKCLAKNETKINEIYLFEALKSAKEDYSKFYFST